MASDSYVYHGENRAHCDESTLWNAGVDEVPFDNPMWICDRTRAKITTALKQDKAKVRFVKMVHGREQESYTCKVLDYNDEDQSFLCEGRLLKPYRVDVRDYVELKILPNTGGSRRSSTRRRRRTKRNRRR